MINQKPTILFVGLDPEQTEVLSQVARDREVEPLFAKTAIHALTLIQQRRPDCIVLDDAIGEVRCLNQEIRQRTSQPIVVLSATDDVALHVSILNDGADDFIVKPCPVIELMARLHALMRRVAWSEQAAGEVTMYTSAHLESQNGRFCVQENTIELFPVESRP